MVSKCCFKLCYLVNKKFFINIKQVPLDEGPAVVALKPVKKASVVDDVITVTDRTSLLVVAALCAAEQDLKVSGSLHEDRDLELSPTGKRFFIDKSLIVTSHIFCSIDISVWFME